MDVATAHDGALKVIQGLIDREASVLAFRDAYYFVILAIGALLPFVWVFRSREFDLANLGGGGAPRANAAASEAKADGSVAH
jgi:hypothetical protein